MGLAGRVTLGLPGRAGVGDRLERPGFVLAPHVQSQRRPERVRVLDQLFSGPESGSVTVTAPAFRVRTAVPVGHPVRVRGYVYPASRRTRQMVYVDTFGSPSGGGPEGPLQEGQGPCPGPVRVGRGRPGRLAEDAVSGGRVVGRGVPTGVPGIQSGQAIAVEPGHQADTASPLVRPAARAAVG